MKTYCGLNDSGEHEHAADCYQDRASATALFDLIRSMWDSDSWPDVEHEIAAAIEAEAAARPDAAALAEAIEIVRQRLMQSDAGHESGWVWPVLDDLARLPAAPTEARYHSQHAHTDEGYCRLKEEPAAAEGDER